MSFAMKRIEKNWSFEDFQRKRREILKKYVSEIKDAEVMADWDRMEDLVYEMHKEDSWMQHMWSHEREHTGEKRPELGNTADQEIDKYLNGSPYSLTQEAKKTFEGNKQKEQVGADASFSEFVRGLFEKNNSETDKSGKRDQAQTGRGKQQSDPVSGTQSVIDLGYGPISMEYDPNEPKGLWKKIKDGEVTEVYHGDGKGSTYHKNPTKPWDYAMGAAKAREQGTAVFANPKGQKETAKNTRKSESDTTVTKSGGVREANDTEYGAFLSSLLGDQKKDGVMDKVGSALEKTAAYSTYGESALQNQAAEKPQKKPALPKQKTSTTAAKNAKKSGNSKILFDK